MSVGGKVIETIDTGSRVWINTEEVLNGQTCAIYVERTPAALSVSPGDSVWWQGSWAMWTPKDKHGRAYSKADMHLARIGFSGVSRPDAAMRGQKT